MEWIKVQDVFEWQPICDELPFQAVSCKIANTSRLFNYMRPNTTEDELTNQMFKYLSNNFVGKVADLLVE